MIAPPIHGMPIHDQMRGALPSQLLRPVASPTQLIERHKEITALIQEALEEGVDYGPIPGTSGKNVLLKPGAERLCVAFGCHPEYRILESNADHEKQNTFEKYGKANRSVGFYRYVVACDLVRDGKVVGSGVGSCSTMEGKYISRPRDCENTVLKMGQKRAMVAAVLNTFALSDRFTQDVDDNEVKSDAGNNPGPGDGSSDSGGGVVVYTGTIEEQEGLAKWLAEAHPEIPEAKYFEIHSRLKGQPKKNVISIIKEVDSVQL